MRDRCHLLFATDEQLHVLSRAKSWYVVGTLKRCRHPFTQLLTINAFVQTDNCAKQVPLAFLLMLGRKKLDYKAAFKAILDVLPIRPFVQQITLGFETALWHVLRQLFPGTKLLVCAFHWTQ